MRPWWPVEFALTPDETMLTGCRLVADRLVIRPTAVARLASLWSVLFFVGFGIVAIAVPQPIFAVPAVACAAYGWLSSRTKVVATTQELTVVNRWQTRHLQWSDVSAIRTEPDDRSWRFPYSGPTQLGRRPKLLVGVVMAGGERVECDSLVSAARSEGWGFGQKVAAEQKVAVLERWRLAVTAP